ncbi:peptidase inhibitor family I36 protein [Streptomyces nigra]|uniref:peptidase inhibitor family I36 protein n=1 Tax=Streptomyces nigra TaxID=1827580 RepID=UPI00381B60AE
MRLKRAVSVAAGAAGLVIGGMTVPASAADYGCPTNYFCFYYNSNGANARWIVESSRADLAGYVFGGLASTPGAGQPVKNNSASAQNSVELSSARVYYNSNFSGASDYFSTGTGKNLVNTYNENASVRIYLDF